MEKLSIGGIELSSRVILAPMAGVTNQAFKSIVREFGAGLICTEMVNDKALLHGNARTIKMIEIDPKEHPVALQLFGSEVDSMVEAAIYLDKKTDCDFIDINMGCPAPKIVKNAAGSKLLLNPNLVYEILDAIVKAVDKPVTVKMRIGWDEDNVNIIENASLAEKAGVSAIFLHGRTTKQYYSGSANWEIIKQVKQVVSIPVIGNGDIDSAQKAKEMIDYSGVDGVMIGRAALGNPWIFKQISEYLDTGVLRPDPTPCEKISMARMHFSRLLDTKDERVSVMEMRGQAAWYLKGIPGANKYKNDLQKVESAAEMFERLDALYALFEKEAL